MGNEAESTRGDRPPRVLLIAGSQRRKHNCPGRYSKARTFMHIVKENPLRFILYIALVAGLAWFSLVPFIRLMYVPGE